MTGSFSIEKEDVKKKCRELISKWGFLRREQRLKEENPAFGNSFAALMQRAEEMLKKKREEQTRQNIAPKDKQSGEGGTLGQQKQQYRAHMIASTGMNYRDSIRRKLVAILRQAQDEMKQNTQISNKDTMSGGKANVKEKEEEWPL